MNEELISIIRKKIDDPAWHPACLLAEVAANPDEDTELRVSCAKSLMPYIEPTLKSVEVKGQIDHNISALQVVYTKSDDTAPLADKFQPGVSKDVPKLELSSDET